MHVTPHLRAGRSARASALVGGLALFAFGIVVMVEADLGLGPWDVLHQGIARQTPLSFGAANVALGGVVLLAVWRLGVPVGMGTVANVVLVGFFVDCFRAAGVASSLAEANVAVRLGAVIAAVAVIGAGTAVYIGADFGAGPRDSLMVVLVARTRSRIGLVRSAIEVVALAAGVALGGTIGVGTVVFLLLIGPAVESFFAALARVGVLTDVAAPHAPAVATPAAGEQA